MARKPLQRSTRLMTNEYHVYDDRITEVAGLPVIDHGEGVRVVHLPPQQAQYLIDQGAIGLKPRGEVSDAAHKVMKQMRHERVEN